MIWNTLTYSCILLHTLAYFGILWLALTYSGLLWHTLAYSGILWHALAYSGIINASSITADGAYHCPVGSIWPFLCASVLKCSTRSCIYFIILGGKKEISGVLCRTELMQIQNRQFEHIPVSCYVGLQTNKTLMIECSEME